jgi:hypothetical protein
MKHDGDCQPSHMFAEHMSCNKLRVLRLVAASGSLQLVPGMLANAKPHTSCMLGRQREPVKHA